MKFVIQLVSDDGAAIFWKDTTSSPEIAIQIIDKMERDSIRKQAWAKECTSCGESYTWFSEDEQEPPIDQMEQEPPIDQMEREEEKHRIYLFLCEDCIAQKETHKVSLPIT